MQKIKLLKDIMNTLKSVPHFLASSLCRSMCLSIILVLFCTSSTLSELNALPGDKGSKSNLGNSVAAENGINLLNKAKANPSEWIICGPTSWEDLKNYLPEAKMAGVSVTAILIPPSQSPPVNPDCPYSEPFGEDYILWAQEIAMLSLRYSNLIGYGIDELQENLNLGYITQAYIESIITAGESINPNLQFINTVTYLPSNNYYVDRDATGAGDGSSWTDASPTLAGLNWATIEAGDTIYISGGADSTVYPKEIISGKVFTSDVYITKGVDDGHNGKVIIQQQGTVSGTLASLAVLYSRYLNFSNITFNSTANTDVYAQYIIKLKGSSDVTFNNCHIVSYGNGFGLGGQNLARISITNSTIETLDNDYDYGQDPITWGASYGGHTITGNTLIQRQDVSTNHGDVLHFHGENSDSGYVTTIANNVFRYVVANTATSANGLIYLEASKTQHYDIYNNIVIWDGVSGFSGLVAYRTAGYTMALEAYNNTFINGGGGNSAVPIVIGNMDTLRIKNNIILDDSTSTGAVITFIQSGLAGITSKEIDYNMYYNRGGSVAFTGYNFANWQSAGYDVHGSISAPTFVNKWGRIPTDYKLMPGSAGIDEGTDASSLFNTDYEGTLRPKGGIWDRGAFEF